MSKMWSVKTGRRMGNLLASKSVVSEWIVQNCPVVGEAFSTHWPPPPPYRTDKHQAAKLPTNPGKQATVYATGKSSFTLERFVPKNIQAKASARESAGDLDASWVAHVYRRKHSATTLSSLSLTHAYPAFGAYQRRLFKRGFVVKWRIKINALAQLRLL